MTEPVNPALDGSIIPLPSSQPIVNADGTPNLYFIRWAQENSQTLIQGITFAQLLAVLAQINITADNGLEGGGNLDQTTITIGMSPIDDVAGAYTNANITVDGFGRVVVAADGSAGIDSIEVSDGTDDFTGITKLLFANAVTITNPITGEAHIEITLPAAAIEVSDGTDDFTGISKLLFSGAVVSNPITGQAEITIAAGSSLEIDDDSGPVATAVTNLKFTGADVTVTSPTANHVVMDVTVPAPPAAEIWAPLVSGAAGPVFITDSSNQCIMTRIV